MAKLRAGLIGLGMMGRHHARILASLDEVEFVAIADPGGDRHNAAAGRPVFATVQQLIDQDIDYCVVAVPTGLHEEASITLASNGIHVLVEKPLAAGIGAAERIAEAFTSRGLVGGVGHIERYNAALQQARQRIENGDLGEIYQIFTRRQGPFPARISDVGVVNDLGTHDIDLTEWVTRQKYRSVSAQTSHRSGREHEDLVAAVARLSGGTLSNHVVNWLSPLKERTTVITGENGTFVADTLTADLTFYANGTVENTWDEIRQFRGPSEGNVTRFAFPKPEPLRVEHENFRNAVLGQPADIVTMDQGLSTVRVAEAFLRSAQTGKTVQIKAF